MEQLVDRAGVSKVELEGELDFPISALTGSEIYRIANLESGWSGTAFLKERFRERSGVLKSRNRADTGRGGRGRSQADGKIAETQVDAAALASYLERSGAPATVIQSESERISRALSQPASNRVEEGGTAYQPSLFPEMEGTETPGQQLAGAATRALRRKRAADSGTAAGALLRDLQVGLSGDWQALARVVDAKSRASSIFADLVDGRIPAWDVTDTLITSPADVMALMQPIRSPYFEKS